MSTKRVPNKFDRIRAEVNAEAEKRRQRKQKADEFFNRKADSFTEAFNQKRGKRK